MKNFLPPNLRLIFTELCLGIILKRDEGSLQNRRVRSLDATGLGSLDWWCLGSHETRMDSMPLAVTHARQSLRNFAGKAGYKAYLEALGATLEAFLH